MQRESLHKLRASRKRIRYLCILESGRVGLDGVVLDHTQRRVSFVDSNRALLAFASDGDERLRILDCMARSDLA